MLKFEVNKQKMIRKDKEYIVDNTIKYLCAEFNFESIEWQDLDKYALFFRDELCYVEHLGKEAECSCIVPFEIMKTNNYFNVSVYGTNIDKKRVTSNKVQIGYHRSGFTENVTSTREPSKDAFNDLYDKIDKINEAIEKLSNKYKIVDDIEEVEDAEDGVIYLAKKNKVENTNDEPKLLYSPDNKAFAEIHEELKSSIDKTNNYNEYMYIDGAMELISDTDDYYTREEINEKLRSIISNFDDKINKVINRVTDVQEEVKYKQDVLDDDIYSSEQNIKPIVFKEDDKTVKTVHILGKGVEEVTIPNEQKQADWADENSESKSFIKNKPNLNIFPNRTEMEYAIGSAIQGITGFEVVEVEELPETGEKGTIYVLNDESSENPTMWLYINSKWLNMGSAPVNLDKYVQKEELNIVLVNRLLSYTTHIETEEAIERHIQNVNQFKAEVYPELPRVGENSVLYLIQHKDNDKIVKAYIYLDDWYFVGGTHLDFRDYVHTDELEANYARIDDVEADYVKKDDMSVYDTSEVVDSKIGAVSQFYCRVVDNLPVKPNLNTVYIVLDSENPDDWFTYIYRDEWYVIGGNLNNYYSKKQVDDKLAGISQFKLVVVPELPIDIIEADKLYLILEDAEKQMYSAHIYHTGAWRHIGYLNGDFNDYYTKSETDNKFDDVDSRIDDIKQFNVIETQTLPEFGAANTLYFIMNSYDSSVRDIYYKTYNGAVPAEWIKVGGSNIDLESIHSLINQKQDKLIGAGGKEAGQNLKTLNGRVLTGYGNINPADMGIPEKTSDLINDSNYTTYPTAKIEITKEENEKEIIYNLTQGTNKLLSYPIRVPKAKIGNAEVVENPEGHPEGLYLKLTFEDSTEVYLPVDSLVGAYTGALRKWQDGEGDELGKLINNIDVIIPDNSLDIQANFNVEPTAAEMEEYKRKKGKEYPYKTSQAWMKALEDALNDIFLNKANLPDEILIKDDFIKNLGIFLGSLAAVSVAVDVGLKMTCTGLQKLIEDLFEKDEGDGKYKWNDENMKPPKQDKLRDKVNIKTVLVGPDEEVSLLTNPEDPVVISYPALTRKPSINEAPLHADNNTCEELSIQSKLVAGNGIFLRTIDDNGHDLTQISTYVPDGNVLKVTQVNDENQLTVASNSITEEEIHSDSLTGFSNANPNGSIARGAVTGGTMRTADGGIQPVGSLAVNCVDGEILKPNSINTQHINPNLKINNDMIVDGSITGSKIKDDSINSNKIIDESIGHGKLSDDAKKRIREEVENNINLGSLRDSENQISANAVHFTDNERQKINNLRAFMNFESAYGNPDDIVFVERQGMTDICLNPKLREDLENKANRTGEKVDELNDNYTTFKNEMDKKIDGFKVTEKLADLAGDFKNVPGESLVFIKQGSFINLTGTIMTVNTVSKGAVICNVPNVDGFLPTTHSSLQIILNTNLTGVSSVVLGLKQESLTGAYLLRLEEVVVPDRSDKLPEGVNIPINLIYNTNQ